MGTASCFEISPSGNFLNYALVHIPSERGNPDPHVWRLIRISGARPSQRYRNQAKVSDLAQNRLNSPFRRNSRSFPEDPGINVV